MISLDGHPVGGALTFSVGAPSITPEAAPSARSPADAERPLRAAIWLARLVLYVGLFCGVGGAFYAAWIASGPLTPRTRRSVAVALECGLVACIVSVGLQGIDVLGLTLPDLRQPRVWMAGLATSYGWTAIIALMSLAAGRIALDMQTRSAQAKPASQACDRTLAALALAGVGIALAGSGHAAAAAPQFSPGPRC